MSLPTSMSWGPTPPQEKLDRLRIDIERAFRGESLPTSLVFSMTNRVMELIVSWDWDQYRWSVHYEEEE
jgi:hypothetical protein